MTKLPLIERFTMTSEAAEREVFHSYTKALCPSCNELVDGARLLRRGKVYLRRQCPEHGASEALISGDADWFLASLSYVKPGSRPLARSTDVRQGCPADCGLCPEHEQHSCLPIIEITNHCNLQCPICIVRNRDNYHMTTTELGRILDGLVQKEGAIETINLSGGEPTLHPQLLELLDMARAKEGITRVSISTNGLRCADDYELCEQLADRGVYVSLQFDGADPTALASLRGGGDHEPARQRALSNLERAGVRTTIVSTIAKGVNDHCVGDCLRLLCDNDFIVSLTFQPAAYVGSGGGCFADHDPLDVMTIPDLVAAIETQSDGMLLRSDFLPLPCSHPSCFALTYLLKTEQSRFVPFPRFLELERYLELITNRGTISPDAQFEHAIRDTIDRLWTSSGQVPDCDQILGCLKRAIFMMYPEERALELEERLQIGESLAKTVFIHGFMDAHTFEVDRIHKCCTHYALPDGRLMPGCAYNNIHRGRDKRFAAAAGEATIWGQREG